MMAKQQYIITIREGDKMVAFYHGGHWLYGCKKCYLLHCLYELSARYSEFNNSEVVFKMGEWDDDKIIKDRIRNSD